MDDVYLKGKSNAEKVKAKGFVCFLLGMFFGRYGVPIMIHGFYIAIIFSLLFKMFIK